MSGHRKSIRLKRYDYAQKGMYYVTVCAGGYGCRRILKNSGNRNVFGCVMDGKMTLNQYGKIIDQCWNEIPKHFLHVELNKYIVMPNHIHGIIMIGERINTSCGECVNTSCSRGTACRAPTIEHFGKPVSGSLSTIIRSFKSAVTKQINIIHNTPGIRYIINNPVN
jgi:REP element-mobilizing transposase RayT